MKRTRKKTDLAVTNIVRLHLRDVCDIKKKLDSRSQESRRGKQPITLRSWLRNRSHSYSHGSTRTRGQGRPILFDSRLLCHS